MTHLSAQTLCHQDLIRRRRNQQRELVQVTSSRLRFPLSSGTERNSKPFQLTYHKTPFPGASQITPGNRKPAEHKQAKGCPGQKPSARQPLMPALCYHSGEWDNQSPEPPSSHF